MSVFSVNTNLGAMAALQSLSQTQNALSNTQSQISTGQKVSSAADNPAVYAISQAMNATISGLSAVQDGLTFASQVVGTASNATSSINSTLASLQNTLTEGQSTGISATQINQSINAALQQIDTFANSATMNGVNLVAGATGNGVNNTQLQVLTASNGSAFNVGGTGAQALNATSAGLGLNGLSVNATAVKVALGADSAATTTNGMALFADGLGATAGATGGLASTGAGSATVNTNVTIQTNNYGVNDGSQTAQNPGQQTVVMLSDGSTTAKQDIMNELNNLVNTATTNNGHAVSGVADFTGTTGTNFTFDNNGNITLTNGQSGGSITNLGNGSTQYSFVVAQDANGNPTQTVSVIAANLNALATSVGGSSNLNTDSKTLAGALNGTVTAGAQSDGTTNSAANLATRQSALATMVGALNAAGFNSSIDANNNLTISGNNINTAGSATPLSTNSNTIATNLTVASGAGITLNKGNLYGVQQTDAAAAISNVTAAITKLGTITSTLGTSSDEIMGMQAYTSALSSALTAGVGALTDADMASESAKLTSLQTKQQLGIQALSIANQQPQALLKLFG